MDYIYFLVRYIPFWAVPLLFISLEFAHRYWRKERRKVARTFAMLAIFSGCMIVAYYVGGGPEKTVKFIINITM